MYLAFACECEEVALSKMKDLTLTAKPLEHPQKHMGSYETVTSSNIHW